MKIKFPVITEQTLQYLTEETFFSAGKEKVYRLNVKRKRRATKQTQIEKVSKS